MRPDAGWVVLVAGLLAMSSVPVQVRSAEAEPSPLLAAAAAYGDAGQVARLLASGIRPDAAVLRLAAIGGHAQVVSLLLETGLDADATLEAERPQPAETALLSASAYGHTDGVTPLMVASTFCQPTLVERLLAGGARPDRRDRRGRTALMVAVTPCAPYASVRLEPRSVALLLADIRALLDPRNPAP